MPLAALLLPLVLQGSAPPPAKGKPVPPKAPAAPSVPAPVGRPATAEEIGKWPGWKIGGGGPMSVAALPWSSDNPMPDPGPEAADATVYRLKVFILRRSESVGTQAEPRPLAAVLDAADEDRARKAIANFGAIVRRVSGNRVRLETSVSTDEDGVGVGGDFAEYVRLRTNGGRFDAEDGVDRGPYSGVMVLGPFLPPTRGGEANGAPVVALDLYRAGVDQGGTQLESSLLEGWFALLDARTRFGIQMLGGPLPNVRDWPDVANWFTTGRRAAIVPGGFLPDGADGFGGVKREMTAPQGADLGPYEPPVGVWIESDPDRGAVLRYREGSYERGGYFTLPALAAPAGKNLSFWVRHATSDPLALYGPMRTVVIGEGGAGEASVPLPADGKWRRVVVQGGEWSRFGPPPSLNGRMRRDNPIVNVWLSDFEWTDDAPTPTALSPRAERLAALAGASPADRLAALASGDSTLAFVALDGLDPATPGFEAAVIPLLSDVNAVLARRAARALAASTSPAAVAALKRALTLGPSEAVRQEAAYALAKRQDPSDIPIIAILLGRPNWRSRLAAVEALGAYRQSNAIRFRLSATLQDNPQIRYAALLPARLDDSDERQKLLYAAINDPSDAVRIMASEKLLDSDDPAVRSEGLRAAADDSAWVRARMQDAFARRKDPGLKDAVLKGAADANPFVRAAATRALGSLGLLSEANAPNLFADANPFVMRALKDEAAAGRANLPEATLSRIRASKDPRVNGS